MVEAAWPNGSVVDTDCLGDSRIPSSSALSSDQRGIEPVSLDAELQAPRRIGSGVEGEKYEARESQ
jgi:hypothetical protein